MIKAKKKLDKGKEEVVRPKQEINKLMKKCQEQRRRIKELELEQLMLKLKGVEENTNTRYNYPNRFVS